MSIEFAMRLAGLLFLLILVINFAMVRLGRKIEVDDYDSDAKLQMISEEPNKFQISVGLALIEHIIIIALGITLFFAFRSYNLILGIVWTIFRAGEGLIYSYSEINYWGLLNIARQFAGASGAEKTSLGDKGRLILDTHNDKFTLGMVFWSLGTLAYSVLFVTTGVLPQFIGWLGIITSVSSGIGYGMKLLKPGFNILLAIGGLSAMLFELILGVRLLFFSPIIP
jgi:hypothetical protein